MVGELSDFHKNTKEAIHAMLAAMHDLSHWGGGRELGRAPIRYEKPLMRTAPPDMSSAGWASSERAGAMAGEAGFFRTNPVSDTASILQIRG